MLIFFLPSQIWNHTRCLQASRVQEFPFSNTVAKFTHSYKCSVVPEHKVMQVFAGQENNAYHKDSTKINSSVRAGSLWDIGLGDFSCNAFWFFTPSPHTEGWSLGNVSQEALQIAPVSRLAVLPVHLGTDLHSQPWNARGVCGSNPCPAQGERLAAVLCPPPSQLVRRRSAGGGAVLPAGVELLSHLHVSPRGGHGIKRWLSPAKSVSQRWNLLTSAASGVKSNSCLLLPSQHTTGESWAKPSERAVTVSGWTQSSCRWIQLWASPPTYPIGMVKWIWGGNLGLRAARSCWAWWAVQRISTQIPTPIATIILCSMWKYKPLFSRLLKPPAAVSSCFLLLAH